MHFFWRRCLFCLVAVLLVPGTCLAQGQRLGGCQTTVQSSGLPALSDSLATAAVAELLTPGSGPRRGPACRSLGVELPVFAQIGALDSLNDETWRAISEQLTQRIADAGLRLAERSALRLTTGTCFPPYHVDFRACADSAAAGRFLADLGDVAWDGFAFAEDRRTRRLFVIAGLSMQLMSTAVNLE